MHRRSYVLAVGLWIFAFLSSAPFSQTSTPLQGSGVTIVGSVVDEALSPISGVAIALERDGRVQKQTTSDAEGKCRFAGVAPGNYRVRAEHKDFLALSRDVKVTIGQ